MKPLLWSRLNIDWQYLNVPILQNIKFVKYTTAVSFGDKPENSSTQTTAKNFRSLLAGFDGTVMRRLSIFDYIPRGGLKTFAKFLPNIQILSFGDIESSTVRWNWISKFKLLKKLYISSCKVNDSHFKDMRAMCNLEELEILDCPRLTEYVLKFISEAPKLAMLRFSVDLYDPECEFNEGPVEKFDNLRSLHLESCMESDFFSTAEQNLGQLRNLTIQYAPIDDTGVFFITKIPCLHDLRLYDCREISDDSLLYISNMASLKKLAVVQCNDFTDGGLRHISKLESLEGLDLSRSGSFTDGGLSYLCCLQRLQRLLINNCNNFTNEGLEHVGKIQTLEALSIRSKNFTDDGLHHLTSLAKLKEFCYRNDSGITKGGVQRAGLPMFLA